MSEHQVRIAAAAGAMIALAFLLPLARSVRVRVGLGRQLRQAMMSWRLYVSALLLGMSSWAILGLSAAPSALALVVSLSLPATLAFLFVASRDRAFMAGAAGGAGGLNTKASSAVRPGARDRRSSARPGTRTRDR